MKRFAAPPRHARGFTLIEVMVVVAIVAVLAAIALPGYAAYMQRGRLTEASAKLSDLRTKLEVFYQDNHNYGTSGTGCGVAVAPSNSAFFNYTCYLTSDPTQVSQADDQSYVVHALGVGNLAGFEYTIDQSAGKQTRAFVGATGLPVACWIIRKGDAC